MIRTDEQIKKDVTDELYWDYKVDASEVKVEVSAGKVTLSGTVPSYTARNAATTDTWKVAGVKGVTNLLGVRFLPTFTVPTDEEIKDSIEKTLAWNPDVYSLDIDISVTGGAVMLKGTVDAYWKKWKAEDLVSDLKGVTNVENHLAVVPTKSFIDKEVAEDIEAALERNLYVNAEDVTVKVENGKATLTGSVPTYYARRMAYNAAAYNPGVIDVNDNIAVV